MNPTITFILTASYCFLVAVSATAANDNSKGELAGSSESNNFNLDDYLESPLTSGARNLDLFDDDEAIEIRSMDQNSRRSLHLPTIKPELDLIPEKDVTKAEGLVHVPIVEKVALPYKSDDKYIYHHKSDVHDKVLYDVFGLSKPKKIQGTWPSHAEVSVDGSGRVYFNPDVGILSQMQCWMHQPDLLYQTFNKDPLAEKNSPEKPLEVVKDTYKEAIDIKQADEKVVGDEVKDSDEHKVEKVADTLLPIKYTKKPETKQKEPNYAVKAGLPKKKRLPYKNIARLRTLESLVEIINLLTKIALDSKGYKDGVLSILVNKLKFTINSTLKQ